MRTPGPPGAWKARTRPGDGIRVRGSSALIRHLDRVAGEPDVALGEAQRQPGGELDLLAHQIDPGDQLGHRMLDLQPGVHLDEVELAVLVEELDRAEAAVVEPAQRRHDQRAQLLALLGAR